MLLNDLNQPVEVKDAPASLEDLTALAVRSKQSEIIYESKPAKAIRNKSSVTNQLARWWDTRVARPMGAPERDPRVSPKEQERLDSVKYGRIGEVVNDLVGNEGAVAEWWDENVARPTLPPEAR
jgi:hypothetical protein